MQFQETLRRVQHGPAEQTIYRIRAEQERLDTFLLINRWALAVAVLVFAASALGTTAAHLALLSPIAGVSGLIIAALLSADWLAQNARLTGAVVCNVAVITGALAVLLLHLPSMLPVVVLAYALLAQGVALLLENRMFWRIAPVCGLVLLLSQAAGWFVAAPQPASLPAWLQGGVLLVLAALAGLLLVLMHQAMSRSEQASARVREQEREIDRRRNALERENDERNQVLDKTLEALESQSVQLRKVTTELQNREATIIALSIPVIPVVDGVLVLPLIGSIDQQRALLIQQTVLQGIEHYQARYLLLDITGVSLLDEQGAQLLQQAMRGAQLLGAELALVGVRPDVARTLVTMGEDMSTLRCYASLQQGLAAYLR